MKKRKNKKRYVLFGFLLIIMGILFPLSKNLYKYYLDSKNNEKIKFFFENENQQDIDFIKWQQEENTSKKYHNNYIAILEIPSIFLQRGLVDINSKLNNVSYNIQILSESDMPNIDGGTMYLASHSGSSYISFFKYLNKVKKNDLAYIYFDHIKYSYKITNIYEETKNGNINIYKDKNKTNLILTTCSKEKKDKQLVVVSELINKEPF